MHPSVISTFSSSSSSSIFVSLPLSKTLKIPNTKRVVSCQVSTPLDFNNMLSLNSMDASVEEIKKAYRKMALQYHPDVCEPSRRDECTLLFVKLQDTYRSLLDQASGRGSNLELKGRRGEGGREWEIQLMELQRRSQSRMQRRDQTWVG